MRILSSHRFYGFQEVEYGHLATELVSGMGKRRATWGTQSFVEDAFAVRLRCSHLESGIFQVGNFASYKRLFSGQPGGGRCLEKREDYHSVSADPGGNADAVEQGRTVESCKESEHRPTPELMAPRADGQSSYASCPRSWHDSRQLAPLFSRTDQR